MYAALAFCLAAMAAFSLVVSSVYRTKLTYFGPKFRSRIAGVHLSKLTQQLSRSLVRHVGSLQHSFHDLIATRVLAGVENPLLPHTELLAVLRSLRDLQQSPS